MSETEHRPRNVISRRQFLGLAGATGAGLLMGLPRISPAAGKGKRPNIVLLMIDTLRADHCGCYGYGRPTTPILDGIAEEGARFETCIASSSWTTPSILSTFTGLSPLHHGVTSVERTLPGKVPTLAGCLKKAGYHTLGVVCNPCAAGRMGFERGFERYDDLTMLSDLDLDLFSLGGDTQRKPIQSVPTSRKITNLVLQHMSRAPGKKPYFLFVLYFDPHHNYVPRARYEKMFAGTYKGPADGDMERLPYDHRYADPADLAHVRALYDAEVRQTDDEVGRLLKTLGRRGLFSDRDLLVVTSDHGEEFNEHGGLRHGPTLYEEVTRVPLVLRWPGKIPAGAAVGGMAGHRDLMPALLRAAGVQPGGNLSSIDLVDMARGGAAERPAVGMHTSVKGELTGLRTPRWAVVREEKTGKLEAYDMRRDAAQQTPRRGEAPETGKAAKLLQRWVAQERQLGRALAGGKEGGKAKLKKEQMRALKSLGYME